MPLSGNGSNGAPTAAGAGGGTVAAPESDKKRKATPISRTRVSGLWIGVILSAVVLWAFWTHVGPRVLQIGAGVLFLVAAATIGAWARRLESREGSLSS